MVEVRGSGRASAQAPHRLSARHKEDTMDKRLPLALELAEPKLVAGEVDIQLCSRTNTKNQSTTYHGRNGILSDITVDIAVDDVIG
jgi:hypothetical protein